MPKPNNSQIDKVLRAAVEREERLCEVLTQADDFWDFFCALLNLPRGAAPHTELLMDLAFRWAGIWVMGLKHQIAALRPFQSSSLVTTLLPTPQHGALPSGHATMATLFSELLIALLQPNDARVAQLDRMARRIAFNRVVAGVHFPLDNAAGYALGQQLAALLKAYATGGEAPVTLQFSGTGGNDLATQNELRETQSRQPATSSTEKVPKQLLLEWMWLQATEELVALKL
ncbi:MAG: phosphatase PAP2 family protein [Burkholderiales bacterium]|nr:phosphatase PAP2 family protein [Burkholderiales bacterium]